MAEIRDSKLFYEQNFGHEKKMLLNLLQAADKNNNPNKKNALVNEAKKLLLDRFDTVNNNRELKRDWYIQLKEKEIAKNVLSGIIKSDKSIRNKLQELKRQGIDIEDILLNQAFNQLQPQILVNGGEPRKLPPLVDRQHQQSPEVLPFPKPEKISVEQRIKEFVEEKEKKEHDAIQDLLAKDLIKKDDLEKEKKDLAQALISEYSKDEKAEEQIGLKDERIRTLKKDIKDLDGKKSKLGQEDKDKVNELNSLIKQKEKELQDNGLQAIKSGQILAWQQEKRSLERKILSRDLEFAKSEGQKKTKKEIEVRDLEGELKNLKEQFQKDQELRKSNPEFSLHRKLLMKTVNSIKQSYAQLDNNAKNDEIDKLWQESQESINKFLLSSGELTEKDIDNLTKINNLLKNASKHPGLEKAVPEAKMVDFKDPANTIAQVLQTINRSVHGMPLVALGGLSVPAEENSIMLNPTAKNYSQLVEGLKEKKIFYEKEMQKALAKGDLQGYKRLKIVKEEIEKITKEKEKIAYANKKEISGFVNKEIEKLEKPINEEEKKRDKLKKEVDDLDGEVTKMAMAGVVTNYSAKYAELTRKQAELSQMETKINGMKEKTYGKDNKYTFSENMKKKLENEYLIRKEYVSLNESLQNLKDLEKQCKDGKLEIKPPKSLLNEQTIISDQIDVNKFNRMELIEKIDKKIKFYDTGINQAKTVEELRKYVRRKDELEKLKLEVDDSKIKSGLKSIQKEEKEEKELFNKIKIDVSHKVATQLAVIKNGYKKDLNIEESFVDLNKKINDYKNKALICVIKGDQKGADGNVSKIDRLIKDEKNKLERKIQEKIQKANHKKEYDRLCEDFEKLNQEAGKEWQKYDNHIARVRHYFLDAKDWAKRDAGVMFIFVKGDIDNLEKCAHKEITIASERRNKMDAKQKEAEKMFAKAKELAAEGKITEARNMAKTANEFLIKDAGTYAFNNQSRYILEGTAKEQKEFREGLDRTIETSELAQKANKKGREVLAMAAGKIVEVRTGNSEAGAATEAAYRVYFNAVEHAAARYLWGTETDEQAKTKFVSDSSEDVIDVAIGYAVGKLMGDKIFGDKEIPKEVLKQIVAEALNKIRQENKEQFDLIMDSIKKGDTQFFTDFIQEVINTIKNQHKP